MRCIELCAVYVSLCSKGLIADTNRYFGVKGFCYFGNRLNAIGGCEAAVTARTTLEWKKFRVWRDTVQKKIFLVDKWKGI